MAQVKLQRLISQSIDPTLLLWRRRELVSLPGGRGSKKKAARHIASLGSGSSGGATARGAGSLGGPSVFGGSLHYHYAYTSGYTRAYAFADSDGAGGVSGPPLMWRQRAVAFGRDGPGQPLVWEGFRLEPPPSPDDALVEIAALHEYEGRLRHDRARRDEIPAQAAGQSPQDMLRVLGIDGMGGFPVTRRLILTVFDITADVGFFYKAKFRRARPNAIDPTLRPALGNPPHEAYPSNHAFQFFSAAEIMNRTVPEIGATSELFFAAQRVAENREYAGVHYASDTEAGKQLAQWFLPYLAEACRELMLEVRREWIG